MSFLTRLFKPADRLPPSLAIDLARLRRALSLLRTPEKDLGLRPLEPAARLAELNKYFGNRLGGSTAEARGTVAEVMSQADEVLPQEIRKTGTSSNGNKGLEVRTKGCADLGLGLSAEQVKDIHRHLEGCRLLLAHDAHIAMESVGSLGDVPASQNYACYDYVDLWSSPHIIELAASERILNTAQEYLGCVPVLYSINAFWSFPNRQPHPYSQLFHRDWEDYRSLVAFTQLTPVATPEDGAHYYVEGSHDVAAFGRSLRSLSVSNEDVALLFGRDGPPIASIAERLFSQTARRFDGPAGRSFCSDGYGLHRALVPHSQPRLLLWMRFGTFFNSTMYRTAATPRSRDVAQSILARIPDTPRHRYVFRYLIDALTGGEPRRR
jgi:hypothetical protein